MTDQIDPFAEEADAPLYLHGLRVRDFRRIDAVDLKFDGDAGLTVISGPNEAGKTSVLRAIDAALGISVPDRATRTGRDVSEVVVDLGGMTARRRFRVDDHGVETSTLEVRDQEGQKQRGPKALLDTVLSKVAVDPLAWVEKGLRGKPGRREQARDLIRALGVVTPREQLIEILKPITDEGVTPTLSDDPIDACACAKADLTRARLDYEKQAKFHGERVTVLTDEWDGTTEAPDVVALKAEGEEIRSELAKHETWSRERDQLSEAIERLEAQLEEAKGSLDMHDLNEPEKPDSRRLQEIERLRDEAAAAAVQVKTGEQITGHQADFEELTAAAALCEQAEAQLREVEAGLLDGKRMPVEGLTVSEDGLLLDGVPFPDGASGEQRIMVGLGVAMHSKPRLRLLRVDDGNRLDRYHRGLLRTMVEEAGYQLLLVLVDDEAAEEGGIVIEEGRVATDAREVPSV